MGRTGEWISARVSEHLKQEIASGNSVREESAEQARDANKVYGIGGWFKVGKQIISLPTDPQKKTG